MPLQGKYLFKTLGKSVRIRNWLALESSTSVHLTFGARSLFVMEGGGLGGGEAVLCTVVCPKAREMRTVAPDLQNWQQSSEGAVLGSSTHVQWLCTRRLPLFGCFFVVKEADNRTCLLGALCKA